MSMELCFFRHGRTEWNAAGRYQGQTDVALDALGHGQAVAVAQRCASMDLRGIYSSDLSRCSDVAARISIRAGYEVRIDPMLRERDFGVWAGLTRAQISERFPDEFKAWQAGDDGVRPGGGEAHSDIAARVGDFIERVRAEHGPGETIVAVTHGGWIRALLRHSLGAAYVPSLFGVPTQGSLTVFRLHDDGRAVLEAFNDRGHLLDVEPVDDESGRIE